MLDFNINGLQEIHFITESVNFPVAIPIYSDWQRVQIKYMMQHLSRLTSEDVIQWCLNHQMQYELLYPMSIWAILRNPL